MRSPSRWIWVALVVAAVAATQTRTRTRQRGWAPLAYDVRDAATGEPIPCKLILVPVDGRRPPRLARGDVGQWHDHAVLVKDRILSLRGQGKVRVPRGRYDVYVSRGPEWDLFVARDLLVGRDGAALAARLNRVIDSRGWISGDFHVHAAPSSDSAVPLEHRVVEFAADGVELIVATDHNVIADYAPAIAALGAETLIAGLIGDEVSGSGGHFGVFPLPADRVGDPYGVALRGRPAAKIIPRIRGDFAGALVSVLHPRRGARSGLFTRERLDAAADRAYGDGFSWDFDAVEVLNGYKPRDWVTTETVLEDWFGLLQHGHLVTAMGNSDTHRMDGVTAGYPRNYLAVADDRPEKLGPDVVARSVREHRVFFTTGPFVRVTAGGGTIGDLVRAPGGRLAVGVEVQAAPWISVSSVVLYVDGREARRFAVPPGDAPVRFRETVDVAVTRDATLVVRVDGDAPMWPIVPERHVLPMALTNPIFVDADGDGAWTAPLPHNH